LALGHAPAADALPCVRAVLLPLTQASSLKAYPWPVCHQGTPLQMLLGSFSTFLPLSLNFLPFDK
jgi:hypothetical protein